MSSDSSAQDTLTSPLACPGPGAERGWHALKRHLACLQHLVFPIVVFYLLFSVVANILHDKGFLLGRHHFLAEHHYEAGFATSRYLLSKAHKVDLICTGDSRVGTGINPGAIDALPCFNLSCGSTTINMIKPVILDSLEKEKCVPKYLLLGVTPDFLSARATSDPASLGDIANYQNAETFRAGEPWTRKLLQRYLPVVYYRELALQDLSALSIMLKQSQPPQVIHGEELNSPVTWQQYFGFPNQRQNEYGWWKDTRGPYVEGSYPASHGQRERLQAPYRPDNAALTDLLAEIRSRRIEPLLLLIPFHDSFYRAHAPGILEACQGALKSVGQKCDVILLQGQVDTKDPKNWYDGHHFSVLGATRLSKTLNQQLRSLKQSGELTARNKRLQ